MENKLKVGQRIDVYNCVANHINSSLYSVGKTYIGDSRGYSRGVFIFVNSDFGMAVIAANEVKKIGCFVVREVYSNRDAETII